MSGKIHDYFERACLRKLDPLRGRKGEVVYDSDGNCAVFWIESKAERIRSAQYRCTTCATLVAFCEHLSELVVGMKIEEAGQYSAEKLLSLHAEVPEMRKSRALLVIGAMRSAVQNNLGGSN
ncbi:MAG: iron-sulfur cluster assembly scaffold protein [Bryobacteraceae bacterium]